MCANLAIERLLGLATNDRGQPALCTVCDHRLTDPAIRACSLSECPHVHNNVVPLASYVAASGTNEERKYIDG